jgi:hypothetical protein
MDEEASNVLVVYGTAARELVAELERAGEAVSPPAHAAADATWHVWTKYYSADVALRVLHTDADADELSADALAAAGVAGALVLAFSHDETDGAEGPGSRARAAWLRALRASADSGAAGLDDDDGGGGGRCAVETVVCAAVWTGVQPMPAPSADLTAWCLDASAELVTFACDAPPPAAVGALAAAAGVESEGVARLAEVLQCHMWASMRMPPGPPPVRRHVTAGARELIGSEDPAYCDDGGGRAAGADADGDALAELARLRAASRRPRVQRALEALAAQIAADAFAVAVAAAAAAAQGEGDAASAEGEAERARASAADASPLPPQPAVPSAVRPSDAAEAVADAVDVPPVGVEGSAAPSASASLSPPPPPAAAASGPDAAAAAAASDDEGETERRLRALMQGAGGPGFPDSGDDDAADERDTNAGLEKLMAEMRTLRDHGGSLEHDARRARAAQLALEAAALCGFDTLGDDEEEDSD